MSHAAIGLLVLALVGLLWAEVCRSPRGKWAFKPLASTLFIVIAINAGALQSGYGHWVLAALAFCWLGDVLLISDLRGPFMAGLGSFLAGHLLYVAAFAHLEIAGSVLTIASGVMVVFAVVVLRWLWVYLSRELRVPVVLYVLAISAMVAMAVATGEVLLALAAVVFAISDLFVARQRFIVRSSTNRLVGLPLYYAAQVVFALSCGWTQ